MIYAYWSKFHTTCIGGYGGYRKNVIWGGAGPLLSGGSSPHLYYVIILPNIYKMSSPPEEKGVKIFRRAFLKAVRTLKR